MTPSSVHGHGAPPPLASDTQALDAAAQLAKRELMRRLDDGQDPSSASVTIAVASIRAKRPERHDLQTLLRQLVLRLPLDGEGNARCLRALVRTGADAHAGRFEYAVSQGGRVGRVGLAGLAELSAQGKAEALRPLSRALGGALKADASFWLSHVCSDAALDALAPHLSTPGAVGLHAATALLAAEEDPFAYESLLERLCRTDETVGAACALWGADGKGTRLIEAEGTLGRWAARGVISAQLGRRTAAVLLAAYGINGNVPAALRALGAGDEVAAYGAQAAWLLGECARARAAVDAMLRRSPRAAALAFAALCGWADLGDEHAMKLVRRIVLSRPVELSRASMLESLVGTRRRSLHRTVVELLHGADPVLALEAGRAVAKLHEPPATVPDLWL